jgi:hypothetical protein
MREADNYGSDYNNICTSFDYDVGSASLRLNLRLIMGTETTATATKEENQTGSPQ